MIHHIWRKIARNQDEESRNRLAQNSWNQPNRISVPVRLDDLPRYYNEPPQRLPYVEDVFDFGVRALPDDAKMMFTPSDIGLATHAAATIEKAFETEDAGDGFRHSFPAGLSELPTDSTISAAPTDSKGIWWFRAGWWRRNRGQFADLILGRAAWDWVAHVILQETATRSYVELLGCAWHVDHPRLYHEDVMVGNQHNLELVRKFLEKHGRGDPAFLKGALMPEAFGLKWNL